jgi:adenosylmethionine-8-amino-7-oxononanoate aminotransferase
MSDLDQVQGLDRVQRTLRARVRHSSASFPDLDRLFPGSYPRVLVRGEGAYVVDDHGRRLLDGGGHLGACAVGHGRAEIGAAMAEQAGELEWGSLDLGLSHPVAAELAERLQPLVPVADPLFLYGSTGSEANETAFKVVRAYHRRRGEPDRVKIIGRDGSYHGSTYGAMSATGIPESREPFAPLVPGFLHVAQPSPGRCGLCTREAGCSLECARDVERAILREGPATVAAVIAEPIAFRQAIKVPHDGYFPALREICTRHGVLLIVDEVITGLGRTGRMFGLDHSGVEADVLTLAKGLTSGYAPLGAAVVSGRIAGAFADAPLAHISTYAGHPVSCRAALATLDILEREDLVANAAACEPVVRECMARLGEELGRGVEISGRGLLTSVELDLPGREPPADAVRRICHECYERGVILRAAAEGDRATVYFYPPLVVTAEDIRAAFAAVTDALRAAIGPE